MLRAPTGYQTVEDAHGLGCQLEAMASPCVGPQELDVRHAHHGNGNLTLHAVGVWVNYQLDAIPYRDHAMPKGRSLHAVSSLVIGGRGRDTACHTEIQPIGSKSLEGTVGGCGCPILGLACGSG